MLPPPDRAPSLLLFPPPRKSTAHPPTHTPPPCLPPPCPLGCTAEDYHWWWRAYLTSGSSALYLFLYSLFYFYTKLDITKLVPALMYFGEAGRQGREGGSREPARERGAGRRFVVCSLGLGLG